MPNPGDPWTNAQEREDAWELSPRAFCQKYPHRSKKALQRFQEKERATRRRHQQITEEAYRPELFDDDLGDPWHLDGNWTIVGDVQAPTTDYEFALRPAVVARQMFQEPRRLLIAGDMLNLDFLSQYAQIVPTPEWKQEKAAGRHLLKVWLDTFDEIRWLRANHESRIARNFDVAFGIEDVAALVGPDDPRIKVSHWSHCTIDSVTGRWRVTHPANYSINQLAVADVLAQKYESHIISFHEHHLAAGWDRFKKYMIINGGGLFEPSRMAYAVLDDSKSAGMAKGFVVLEDGFPHVFGEEPFTDWSKWLD